MLIYWYSPSHVPRTLFLGRMKSITEQLWLDKHATFRHESLKRAGNDRSFPGPAALSGTFRVLQFFRIFSSFQLDIPNV